MKIRKRSVRDVFQLECDDIVTHLTLANDQIYPTHVGTSDIQIYQTPMWMKGTHEMNGFPSFRSLSTARCKASAAPPLSN